MLEYLYISKSHTDTYIQSRKAEQGYTAIW